MKNFYFILFYCILLTSLTNICLGQTICIFNGSFEYSENDNKIS